MAQSIKVSLDGRLLKEVVAAAGLDEVSAPEAIRRILWCHFEARGGPGLGPNSAHFGPKASHRPSSLPRPLPSPQGRGSTEETKAKAKAKAPASEDSPNARCSGGAREAPAYARPGRRSGPESAQLDLVPAPAPLAPEPPPPVMWLPCRATRRGDPPAWGLSGEQVERWQAVFPGLDVFGEARKAESWLQANPGRWKTPRGIERFLFSWLDRANDRGRSGRPEPAARRAGNRWSPAVDQPAPPPKGSIREAYGRDSFEEWEAELRGGMADEPEALERCLRELAQLRGRWEAKHAA